MADTLEHYAVVDRPSADPAPLTPEQLDELERQATGVAFSVAIVEKPVLAALLAAYRREVRMHLNNAYRYLHQVEDLRIGPNRTELLWRAVEHLDQAGYLDLAVEAYEDGNLRRVTDAVREALRIGEK